MPEKLTLGQMIDQLKVGEVAEGTFGEIVGYVTKTKLGNIVLCSETGSPVMHREVMVNLRVSPENMQSEWTILPRYVTFEEAMKALKEYGKEVRFLELAKRNKELEDKLSGKEN